jgi:hypothetical protein
MRAVMIRMCLGQCSTGIAFKETKVIAKEKQA